MSSVAVQNNLASFIDAVVAGDSQELTRLAREVLTRAEESSELIGQIGSIAMRGDSEGHAVLTLGAASALCRWLIPLRHALGEDTSGQTIGIPLVVQALLAATPAVRAGKDAPQDYPQAIFPSEIPEEETVASRIHQAIYDGDVTMVERLLRGFYGTGADYRTLSLHIYEGISQTFQEDGHSLIDAVRGAQVLDAVVWGDDEPYYIHWLAPHLVLHTEEPAWMQVVRSFLQEPQHSLTSYRTRLAAPQNANALPLRSLLLSEATPEQVCQGVYDALIKNGASAPGVGSVIALAATDLLQNIGDDRDLFVRTSHGLLFASATRRIYTQVQAVETLPLLFTAAVAINALYKDLSTQTAASKAERSSSAGGGLIAPALLESLSEQIEAQDIAAALASTRRYILLGHDTYALFGVIGLAAAQADASTDQGHTLQIVLAAGDEYLAWPKDLASTNIEGFLQVALRAATFAKRNALARV